VSSGSRSTQERTWSFDRHRLPGFDPFVYVAMAEDPAFFTVGPWGYRVLNPWLVHELGGDDVVKGYRRLSVVALALSGALLFVFLRRLGNGEVLCLAAVAALCLSAPTDQALTGFFLVEPLGLLVFLLLLLSLDLGNPLLMAATLALGALTKEIFILLLPAVFAPLCERLGRRRGFVAGMLACAPALLIHMTLHWWWAPFAGAGVVPPWPRADDFWLALYRVLAAFADWWQPVVACGLPLAIIGAMLVRGHSLLRRYAYVLAFTLALPFAAGLYTGESAPASQFFADDVSRLLLYALPLVFSLALVALDRVWPHLSPPSPLPPPPGGGLSILAMATIAGTVVFPFLALDGYRRTDLRRTRDGAYVLAFCRETLAFARRLEQGKPVIYDPTGRRFDPVRSDRHHLERMRWFLREGWGPKPQYGMGEVVMRAEAASIVVPVLRPRDVDLAIALASRRPTEVQVEINGHPVGTVPVDPLGPRNRLTLAGVDLFRGDNRLTLRDPDPTEDAIRLLTLNLRASSFSRAETKDP
jgi:hypothetical protein